MNFTDVQAINLLARLGDYALANSNEVRASVTVCDLLDDLVSSLESSPYKSATHQGNRAEEAWGMERTP